MKILSIYCLSILYLLFIFSSYAAAQSSQGKEKKYFIDLGSSGSDKTYRVIHVNGNIYIGNNFEKKIKAGDKLSGNMQITAKTKDVFMTVYNINDNIGRQSLSPMKFKKYRYGRIDLFFDFLKSYFIPSPKIPATRDGILNNKPDVFNHFRATTRKDIHLKPYLVLGTSKIYISPEVYPLNDGSFFFIRYIYHGEKIDKKIPSQGNFITIARDNLYRIDDKPVYSQGIEKVMQVYYYNRPKNRSVLISGFHPVFPNEKKLIKEVSALISALKASGRSSEILDEVLSFLYEFYGTPYRDNVKIWLKKNFGSEIQ